MDYYRIVCYKYINHNYKYKHFKSKSHKQFDYCKDIILSLKDIDIKTVDEAFYLYNTEHNKKYDYYLIKCSFQLVSDDYEYCPYITSNLSDIKTMISWQKFLENANEDFINKE